MMFLIPQSFESHFLKYFVIVINDQIKAIWDRQKMCAFLFRKAVTKATV